ncbi:hypothetical protein AYO46_04560 [Betaproteobacteria bacterium SCGC AG-212-J23]|nr:hypothetical protein AYO46_04560 [Betaproteobacteria bacterium SCGC AG-212-J23]
MRVTGAGRLADFRERLRWLMVRDFEAEGYTEHHAEDRLEYRFEPKRGIPFPVFTEVSGNFPELRVEAEWDHDGVRGRAVIENGRLVEEHHDSSGGPGIEIAVDDEGRLGLAMVVEKRDACCIGYAATAERHTFFRFVGGALDLIDPEEPDVELEDMALAFVEEWIWYDEEEAPVERARYASYGFPVRGANLRSEKLALLRGSGQCHSSLDEAGRAAREALVREWLSK